MIQIVKEAKEDKTFDFPEDFLEFCVKVSKVCCIACQLNAMRSILAGKANGLEIIRDSVSKERERLRNHWQSQLPAAMDQGGVDRFLEDFTVRDAEIRRKEILVEALFAKFAMESDRWEEKTEGKEG